MVMASETMLRILAMIIDERVPESDRIEALGAVIATLPEAHPYRSVPIDRLYARLLPSWAMRMHLRNGRGILGVVNRPALSLADIL
jgi:hypothetical protein